ncbi:NAD-dependent epimerase/dehydratase family protein [Haladaptatus sp. GCM10025707]|uniref:NAD-dependent epimerase/dehydratase family protein n=1 Tax=unclassified Haladaptatus TaxID=2622732 RepID=UPI0023E8F4A4|nr:MULTISPECIES: NAD(P)-dependent oxidoreductase [unclassified Haladaptatus]
MRVLIAGATGVLGRRLVADCVERGHEVIGLARDRDGAWSVRRAGGTARYGDVLDRESLSAAATGADVVINAATAIPTSARPRRTEWRLNDRVRREGTRNLTEVAVEAGVSQFIQQSIVWVARQPDGSDFDEDSTPHPDRTTASALDAEHIVTAAGTTHGFDTTLLRCGWFYSADSAQTQAIARGLLARRMPIIGRGDARMSHIHVADASTAFVTAMETGVAGRYHIVDDAPVSMAHYLGTFALALGAPEPRHIPPLLGRLVAGGDVVRFLTQPMPTSATRFHDATGWTPRYPTITEGLPAVCEEWRGAGVVVETDTGTAWAAA